MSDQHQDDRLDELLREAARDYNPPPATPRELMWSRIEAVRRGAGLGTRHSALGGVVPIRPHARRQWVRWGVGIAAALALGFGLGRWRVPDADRPGRPPAAGETSTPVAASIPSPAPSDTLGGAVRAVEPVPAESPATSPPRSQPSALREQRLARTGTPDDARDTGGAPTRPLGAAECTRPPSAGTRPSAECRLPSPAYTLAAIQHLTQAEALLTSFRAETRGGKQMDAQLSVWANDLLGSTRLLLDSPAGGDPRMRRLLEDLELVLAQIAQLGAERAGTERNLIDEAVEGRSVLPRLRTTIPAGTRPVGS